MENQLKYNAYWREMHDFAYSCNTIAEINTFYIWIYNLAKRFFCDKCKKHFREYLFKHPVQDSPDPFEWTWRFHNAVNLRLGKDVYPLEQALHDVNNPVACESCKNDK